MNAWFVRNVTFPLFQMYVGEHLLDRLQDLEQTQWYPSDHVQELQWRKVKTLLAHCYHNVPYYHEMFEQLGIHPDDVKDLEDFRRLPVLTKPVLRNNLYALLAQDKARPFRKLVSSGSTGLPLQVQISREANSHRLAAQVRGWRWWGWDIGEPSVWLWGTPTAERTTSFHAKLKGVKRRWVDNARHFSVHDLTPESMRDYYQRMCQFQPRLMYGYTSSLYEFARFILEDGLDGSAMGLEAVCTSCEVLYPHQRRVIEEAFACSTFDEYGCCEVGVLAMQCPEGNMHLTSENALVEFLVDGQPAHPGQMARVVVTDLNDYHLPLLRYSLGDVGCYAEGTCACGRGLPLMEISIGRELDMIHLRNGKSLHPHILYLNYEGALLDNVEGYKIIQQALDRFLIQVEAVPGSEGVITREFTALVQERLGQDVRVECQFLPHIPREESGKLRYFVSNIGG
jgi:phenylacetate-CoA ligase